MKKRPPLTIACAVVFALVLREIRTRFGSRRMGAFWMIFEPIAHIAFMMFVVTVLRGRHVTGMPYPIYLLTGIVPFFLMRNIAMKLMDAPSANKSLFAYPNIRPFNTFVARLIVELSLTACVYTLLLIIMGVWFGYDVLTNSPLEWFFVLVIGVVFSFGLGIILCIVGEKFPNSKTFMRLAFMLLYVVSGVIFPLWRLPQEFLPWILWNPYTHIIDNLRSTFFAHYPSIEGISYSYPAIAAVVVLFIGLALYRVYQRDLLAI
ncbi:sugar ABC transporter permease [Bordetella trematum]|uniref:Transport permease protein n=1 Tax=Bordetella trematum TaxID=123899 RepID=A0A157S976_9BORD|nr:ABC transporter permease [Bordetella trematum]AUL48326.1 sugar ABC transporter permease [Bordetella trematum]AZR95284.1 sugar ABC transporter permease [Bordetella trematum]NNH18165.1 ABC transporter permease [Bordetella trematum]SAI49130.1 permease of an ABC exporter involved in polysaccharide export [Bordetella trematum]SAI66957.1 permease of an ABC exporter involved in polysaccharide export [Bordetella trematum]